MNWTGRLIENVSLFIGKQNRFASLLSENGGIFVPMARGGGVKENPPYIQSEYETTNSVQEKGLRIKGEGCSGQWHVSFNYTIPGFFLPLTWSADFYVAILL